LISFRAGPPRARGAEAVLDLLDPGLQHRHVPLQLREVTLEALASPPVVGQSRLDPPERLRDRRVFLLEPFESAVDHVEVAEDLVANLGETCVQPGEPVVDLTEALVDLGEAPVDLGELLAEELDELLGLGGTHARGLSQPSVTFQVPAGPGASRRHPRRQTPR
jgi:hypothetical protein